MILVSASTFAYGIDSNGWKSGKCLCMCAHVCFIQGVHELLKDLDFRGMSGGGRGVSVIRDVARKREKYWENYSLIL